MASFHIFKCLFSLSLFLSQCFLVSFYFAELKLEARNRNMHKPGAATTTFYFYFLGHFIVCRLSHSPVQPKPFSLFLLNFLLSVGLSCHLYFSELFRFAETRVTLSFSCRAYERCIFRFLLPSMRLYGWQSHSVPLRLYFTKLAKLLCTPFAVYSLALWLCNHFHLLDAPCILNHVVLSWALGFRCTWCRAQGSQTHTHTHRAFILYLASSMYHHYVLELNNSNGVAR